MCGWFINFQLNPETNVKGRNAGTGTIVLSFPGLNRKKIQELSWTNRHPSGPSPSRPRDTSVSLHHGGSMRLHPPPGLLSASQSFFSWISSFECKAWVFSPITHFAPEQSKAAEALKLQLLDYDEQSSCEGLKSLQPHSRHRALQPPHNPPGGIDHMQKRLKLQFLL